MLELYIGYKTEVPNGEDMFFNIEIESETYPKIENIDMLKSFLNYNSNQIVDKVVHVIDKTTSELIWSVE